MCTRKNKKDQYPINPTEVLAEIVKAYLFLYVLVILLLGALCFLAIGIIAGVSTGLLLLVLHLAKINVWYVVAVLLIVSAITTGFLKRKLRR